VVDGIEHHVMADYSYRGLGDYRDDILLIEWDMAVSAEDLARFRERIAADPSRVLVAPYRIYEATTRPTKLPMGPVWVHRKYVDGSKGSSRFVDEGDPDADLWGLGLTYLPRDIIREFLEFWPGHFSDVSLSGWHYDRYGSVPIAWDVRPIHLHYTI
jgi:hypothetical protein